MPVYDSMFTDRLFYGQRGLPTDGASNKLDLTGPLLSSKLWKKVPITTAKVYSNAISPDYGIFFIAKTFSTTDSDILTDYITTKKSGVNFYNNGDILIKGTGGDIILNFKNPLTPAVTQEGLSSIFDTSLLRDEFILCPNKHWILYKEDNIYYLLYNPIHRQSFKGYYNKQPLSNGTNQVLNDLFNQYCEINSKPNDTTAPRKYSDKTCNCIRIEDRIDNAAGGYIDNTNYRNSIRAASVCVAPECSTNLTVDDTSFMYVGDSNGFYNKIIDNLAGKKCPDIKNILCTTELNAGGNINVSGTIISQVCGDSPETTTKAPTPTSMTTTTPPVIPIPTPTPTPISLIIGASVGGVLVLVLIIVLIIRFNKKKT